MTAICDLKKYTVSIAYSGVDVRKDYDSDQLLDFLTGLFAERLQEIK